MKEMWDWNEKKARGVWDLCDPCFELNRLLSEEY
jgi:hypothetical protein